MNTDLVNANWKLMQDKLKENEKEIEKLKNENLILINKIKESKTYIDGVLIDVTNLSKNITNNYLSSHLIKIIFNLKRISSLLRKIYL